MMKSIFLYFATLLIEIAAALFVFAILIAGNRVEGGHILSWDAPMPWAIILTMTGLAILYAVQNVPHDDLTPVSAQAK